MVQVTNLAARVPNRVEMSRPQKCWRCCRVAMRDKHLSAFPLELWCATDCLVSICVCGVCSFSISVSLSMCRCGGFEIIRSLARHARVLDRLHVLQNDMPLLQPQGRLNSMQRAEFYKQYYHEMIRRGTEGLRNMNVDLGSDNMAWLGPDGAPVAGLPTPDTQVRSNTLYCTQVAASAACSSVYCEFTRSPSRYQLLSLMLPSKRCVCIVCGLQLCGS